MKKKFQITIAVLILALSIKAEAQDIKGADGQTKFPKGEKVATNTFTGNVWMKVLLSEDTMFNYHTANVTFAPGARTYWHKHPGGQVLIAMEGIGYYQEKGKALQILRPGDVAKCLPDVEHWHGASPNSEFSHIGITKKTPKGIAIWLQPVTEEEYKNAK